MRDAEIRLAAPEEAVAVYAIMKAAFAQYASEALPSSALVETVSDVEAVMARGGAILVCAPGEVVAFLGSARFVVDEGAGFLSYERLSVLPASRGQGIGGTMIDWLERHARDRGVSEVRATARSQQPDNRPYYLARGYEISGYSERYGIPDIRTHLRKRL